MVVLILGYALCLGTKCVLICLEPIPVITCDQQLVLENCLLDAVQLMYYILVGVFLLKTSSKLQVSFHFKTTLCD